jgi:D-alanyl-D-alanine carboxypeptidase
MRFRPALALALLLFPVGLAARPAMQAVIREVIRKEAPQFSGTVLVTRAGKVLGRGSFGLANRAWSVPNANDTRFKIASITKLFTSVIALQLHDEGKLALDVPIATYLPACGGELGAKVTVHHLLNHTSGMRDVAAVASMEDAIRHGIDLYQRPYTVDELVAKFCSAPVVSAPGAAFNYNNGEYIVLGRMIEAIEGRPFKDVLARRILQPLGMRDAGVVRQERVIPRLAETYFTRDPAAGLTNDLPVYNENWYAAGAMYSTAPDLRRFADALFGHRLLREETLALLLRPGLDKYGYGAWIYEDTIAGKKYTSVMRPGQIMGANTVLYHVIEANLTIVILSNTDQSNVDALAYALTKAILER